MGSRTHYDVLGVSPSADRPSIEKAYRRKVRFVHPDVSDDPDSLERFYTIQRAYETLRDPEKRREYDTQLVERAAPTESPVVAKRAAARRRAAEAREQAGVSSPGGFVYTAGPFWDPASNPVLRRKIQKSRRRKWLARLETAMLSVNVLLLIAAAVVGGLLVFDPIDTRPVRLHSANPAERPSSAIDRPVPEVEVWLEAVTPGIKFEAAPTIPSQLPLDGEPGAHDIDPLSSGDDEFELNLE